MKKAEVVINRHRQPLTLETGVILAAAGTDGSRRENVLFTEADERRYVSTELISVSGVTEVLDEVPDAPPQPPVESQAVLSDPGSVQQLSRKGDRSR